jgi:mRNA interferase MazF
MARRVGRGEVWTYRFAAPDKRRPVLVLSREDAIRVLSTVIVAPITSTIHGVPSEVVIGIREGLKHVSAVNLDHVQTVPTARLVRYVGQLDFEKMGAVCRALAVATGCSV